MSQSEPEARLRTARALLSPQRVGVSLEEVPPDPPPERVGAVAAFGAVVMGHDLRLSVYVFDAWGRGHDHAEALRVRAEADGRLGIAVNGELLLVGTIPVEGWSAEQFLLNDLCSAFAGRE